MGGSLRRKLQFFGFSLVALCLLASSLSLYRIAEVGRSLQSVNSVSIPLGHLLMQLKSDADVLKRETERSLGKSHWDDPHWKPRAVPEWIINIVREEILKLDHLVQSSSDLSQEWKDWSLRVSSDLERLRTDAHRIHQLIEKRNILEASQLQQKWQAGMEDWARQLNWGIRESDHLSQIKFAQSMEKVLQLRTGLETVLMIVVLLSILMIWMGEKTLRPLGQLTQLAREISQRGLRRQDKALLPKIYTQRQDEIGQLAQEFQRMATALLEREKDLEMQKSCIQQQNTQLKEMVELQRRLRHAEDLAAMGRMSAQVAHEVRNPLHSIGLEAELAAELAQNHGIPELRQSALSILASVDRLETITDNYLKLSRLSSGNKKQFPISDLLQSVLATYAPVCEAQGVKVNWSIGERALQIEGDQSLLEQVLGNLLRNSLQALEGAHTSNPKIELSVGATEAGGSWLCIHDNGPGISQEQQCKLFIPFETTKAQGTGLGLSFSKKVMEDHGGRIEYSGDDAGQTAGASFLLIFPAYLNTEGHVDHGIEHLVSG